MNEALAWAPRSLVFERRLLSVLSGGWRVVDGDGRTLFFLERSLTPFGDETLLFEDEACLHPLLVLHRRSRSLGNELHDLFIPQGWQRVATLQGSTPLLGRLQELFGARQEWVLFDGEGRPVGAVEAEGSLVNWVLGRRRFRLFLGDEHVARLEAEGGRLWRRFRLTLVPASKPVELHFAVVCVLPAIWYCLRSR